MAAVDKYRAKEKDTSKILVVDDEENVRKTLRHSLAKQKWLVREAGNGEEALKLLKKDKPNVILLDLLMPVMDGFDFIDHLRTSRDYLKIPVIVITAKNITAEDRTRLNGRVIQIIKKSGFSKDNLFKTLASLLNR